MLLLAGVSSLPFDHCLSIYTSLIYTLYPPPTHYFDSRWGFTIVIFPLAFVYIRYTHPSYTPSTLHRHKILILAGVLPLSFFHWHLHIYIFIYSLTHCHIHPLLSTDPLFCFSLGFHHCHFTIAICRYTPSYALAPSFSPLPHL